MPCLSGQVSAGGPLIDVLIGVSQPRKDALVAAAQPVPPAIPVRALIDTGAGCTCLDPQIITQLALTPTGKTPVFTPSTGATAVEFDQYDVHIVLIHPALQFNIWSHPIVASALAHQGFHLLLGRDVLRTCHFSYQGHAGTFSLCF
jgi:hypothetical protein